MGSSFDIGVFKGRMARAIEFLDSHETQSLEELGDKFESILDMLADIKSQCR